MTAKLKEILKNISSEPKTEEELDRGARLLVGFAKCLMFMYQENKENESRYINPCINQDARGGFEFNSSK